MYLEGTTLEFIKESDEDDESHDEPADVLNNREKCNRITKSIKVQ